MLETERKRGTLKSIDHILYFIQLYLYSSFANNLFDISYKTYWVHIMRA